MKNQRREFIKTSVAIGALGSISAVNIIPGCKAENEEEKEVSPPEDLMQEHGLLNRILLIYDCCRTRLVNKESFPHVVISDAGTIMRTFIEDYHERQEEKYLFPRFQKANQLVDLVNVLLVQHQSGRTLTDGIIQLGKQVTRTDNEDQKLVDLLTAFNTMYRPHEAREDTVLFPAFRKLVSRHEYDSLGEDFEKNEHRLFGEDGFATMVEKVTNIEKQIGIYELSRFTPQF